MTLSRSEIESRAIARFGEPNMRLSSRHELRFGHKGSVSVRLTGDKAGCWYDFEAADGHTLLSRAEIPEHVPVSVRARFEHATESAHSLQNALRNSQSIHGTPAELYLLKRGITAWPDHSIRFCRKPHGLCGIAQAVDGSIKAAQIVYLTDDGRKTPHLRVKKRTYIDCTNWHEIAAVRLPGRGEPILCEGIETGLSIWCSLEPRRPVHVCLGIAGIRALRLTSKRVTIARDGDEPSDKPVACSTCKCPADHAIHLAVEARQRRCQTVRIASPPLGMDFNDLLRQAGSDAVSLAIRNAHG